MTTKAITILDDKRLFPTVMNVIEGSNKVDTAVYTMENYIVNEIDLSKYDWYAHFIGVGGVDEVKLTSKVVDGKLVITFDLTEFVTRIGNTLTYQLVAKDTQSAVWYSSKGIILNSDSIQADDFVVANYPSILKQWENRLEEIISGQDNAYVIIPYDERIPVENRIAGKFYLQRLNDVDYSCVIEDAEGHVITDGNTVHKTGNETIKGVKTFSKDNDFGVINLKSANVDYLNKPTATDEQNTMVGSVDFLDKNENVCARMFSQRLNTGNSISALAVRNKNGSWAQIGVSIDEDGKVRGYAPTPSDDVIGNEIVTASWVNKKTQPATTTTYGLMRVAAPVDETDCSCNDAGITPSNLYDLANYRIANTSYAVGNVVGCPYHANLILRCTTAGRTSSESLDTSGSLYAGNTLTDGSVVWTVDDVATTAWVSNNAVKLTGDQTVTGQKTFTGDIVRTDSLDGVGTRTLKTVDTNGNGSTSLVSYYTGEKIYHRLLAENTTAGKSVYLDVIAKDDGTAELQFTGSATSKYVSFNSATKVRVPTAGSSAETTEAVNIGYLNSKVANYLPLTGGTITGDLIRKIDVDVSSNPSSIKYILPFAVDNADSSLRAYQQLKHETNGKTTYTIGLRRTVNGENKFNVIDLETDASGNTAVKVLNPPTSSNDQSIATTAWVHNAKSIIVGWCIPDYTAGISFTSNTNYTAPNSGYVVFDSHSSSKFYEITVYVDDIEVFYAHTGDYAKYPFIFPVKAGQKVRISDESFRGTFYPMKGL